MTVNSKSVLIVDDEPGMRAALQASFHRDGWYVETASSADDAIGKFERTRFPLVVTDVRMPDGDGLNVMRRVRACEPSTAVILLTAFGSVPEAVQAIQGGACDYLMKPFSFDQLQQAIRRVMNHSNTSVEGVSAASDIVGSAPALVRTLDRARHAARTSADVLIEAESGTGKELIARFIHDMSDRRDQPFVAVNCAAVPANLLESELFGHAKGAFTGANSAKVGRFELAEGGTFLLDEVGEMPLELQPKLLRALQEREFERLGGTRTIRVNMRVIATTNVSLHAMVEDGLFRSDLYYRLNVIPLSVPPLRDRREDIPELARFFAAKFASQAGRSVPRLSLEFMAGLQKFSWPGNVRELSNFLQRVIAMSDSADIGAEYLADYLKPSSLKTAARPLPVQVGASMRQLERKLLETTLEATRGNRTRAAEMLGVSLRTMRNKIREYGLPPRRYAQV